MKYTKHTKTINHIYYRQERDVELSSIPGKGINYINSLWRWHIKNKTFLAQKWDKDNNRWFKYGNYGRKRFLLFCENNNMKAITEKEAIIRICTNTI